MKTAAVINTPAAAGVNTLVRLRIAVLNRNFSPTGGGAERYSIALVEQLAARHEVHVFAQQMDHQFAGVTYHRLPGGPARPRWVNQLWFALTSWWATRSGFDVVHSHENTWHGQVQTVHVLPIRHTLLQGRSGWRRALRWVKIATSPRLIVYLALERARYKHQAKRRVVVTSTSLQAVMAQTYPHTAQFMAVVTPGVAQVAGPVSAPAREAARLQLGLPVQGRCVLFVGNDYRKKGLPALIEALRTLPDDCYVAVVGNPTHIPTFREAAVAAGVESRVHFLGALDAVDVAYRAADCLAHPTLEDTFAMVVLEAMAHGLPVVVSGARYCGIAELLQHEHNALLLDDPHNAAALASALQHIFTDEALANQLRTSAQAFAQAHLWSALARQQEALYTEVALK
jgi:glycosyltransferase involved in cell wall biosynthesis